MRRKAAYPLHRPLPPAIPDGGALPLRWMALQGRVSAFDVFEHDFMRFRAGRLKTPLEGQEKLF